MAELGCGVSFSPESGKPRAAIRLRRCCWRRKSCVRTRRGGACLALWPAVRGWRWSGFTPAGAGQASASPSRSRTWRLPFHRPRGALPAFPLPYVSVPSRGPEGCFQGDAGQRRTAISLGRTRPLTSVASILLPGCSRAAVVTSLSRAGARLTFSSLCELDPASHCSLLKQI